MFVGRFLREIKSEIKSKVILESINVAYDIVYNLIFSTAAGAQSICEKIMRGKLTQDNAVLASHLGKDYVFQISKYIALHYQKEQIFKGKHCNVIVTAI